MKSIWKLKGSTLVKSLDEIYSIYEANFIKFYVQFLPKITNSSKELNDNNKKSIAYPKDVTIHKKKLCIN